jgi:CO/xanthine dehydrogenase FAD-binding subunit
MTRGARTLEVLLPTSPAEAIESFGDGVGVTVVGGGTILMPEIAYGRLKPSRVVLLAKAGLDRITRENGVVTIGAGVPIAALEGGDEPLASAARHVGDPEIRAQATVGGNLCAGPGSESPRGDLHAPLIALGARVRSIGAGGERVEQLEDFLAGGSGRLVLDVSYDDEARAASHAAVRRPHAHHPTILSVCAVRTGEGVRVAVTGAGPLGRRCTSVEAAVAEGAQPPEAGAKVLDDVEPADDALASAWYRRRVLPGLVTRALSDLSQEGR